MSLFLESKNVKLELSAAGENYRAERFDWNGSVVQMYYKGLPLLALETEEKDFNGEVNARGLFGEFGIKHCIGYDEVAEGEFFPKIGTGWLKKDSKPYFFFTRYERKPLEYSYSINREENSVTFTCVSGEENGWSYTYSKKVKVTDDGLVESYIFKNTGTKSIETTHYVHNFFKPGAENIGPHISVKYPVDFDYSLLTENVHSEGLINKDNGNLTFIKEPETDYYFGGVWVANGRYEPKTGEASWVLTDSLHGLQISETDDFKPWNSDLWGYKKNVSPEIFFYLKAAPGETVEWSRTYRISEISR